MDTKNETPCLKEFKSKDREYLLFIILTAASAVFNVIAEEYFLSVLMIVLSSLSLAFHLNRKSRFLIFYDQIVINKKNNVIVFKILEINKIYFKNGIFGPYICIENKNGDKSSLVFYEFEYLEIGKELLMVNENIVDSQSFSKARANYQILKIKEENAKSMRFFHFAFPLLLIVPCFFIVNVAHSMFMKNFTETNYHLMYFVNDWIGNLYMLLLCSMLLFLAMMSFVAIRTEYLKNKYLLNNQAEHLKNYKSSLGSFKFISYLMPIIFLVISFIFHLGPNTYIAPAPFVNTEFIKDQNAIAEIDMRYICKKCRHSISKGHIVYYYNSVGRLTAGVAATQINVNSSLKRELASYEKSIEVYTDNEMNLENVEFNRILGIARNKDRKEIFIEF